MGDDRATVLVFGDQLDVELGALGAATPDTHRVLLVESAQLLRPSRHRQRLHLVLTAMRRFADELRDRGFEVELRRAATLRDGVQRHVEDHGVRHLTATEPNSRAARRLCAELDVELVRSEQFLCHPNDFAAWADGRSTLRMEDFYRWQRRRLDVLMEGEEPVSGRWNHDADNREPPPDDDPFPTPVRSRLDEVDDQVLADLGDLGWGEDPQGWWPTSRRAALARLRHFVDDVLPLFGPYEDAMTSRSWHLGHSLLSPALNLGLLRPRECVDAVIEAYEQGRAPINSVEGFVRQVIGWREYVWNLYWHWPDHADTNVLGNDQPLPPAFTGEASTDLACLRSALDGLHARGWVHHIERLMVLANISNLVGVAPRAVARWMDHAYVDGAEWVMVPNVHGMAMWADGGRMATKPYVSGGAYVDRMSDHCGGCRFDPRKRVGDDACPLTSWYWDFVARNREPLAASHRMGRPLANLDRLSDVPAVRARAAEVRDALLAGEL